MELTRKARKTKVAVMANGNEEKLMRLPIMGLNRTAGTQLRVKLDPEAVELYRERYANGEPMDPIRVVRTEAHGDIVWDGFTRTKAAGDAGEIAINALVRTGTLDDAVRLAFEDANNRHGFRYTNDDKRNKAQRAVLMLAYSTMSNRELGRKISVSEGLIRKVRKELEASGQIEARETVTVQRNGQQVQMDVSKQAEAAQKRVMNKAQERLEVADLIAGDKELLRAIAMVRHGVADDSFAGSTEYDVGQNTFRWQTPNPNKASVKVQCNGMDSTYFSFPVDVIEQKLSFCYIHELEWAVRCYLDEATAEQIEALENRKFDAAFVSLLPVPHRVRDAKQAVGQTLADRRDSSAEESQDEPWAALDTGDLQREVNRLLVANFRWPHDIAQHFADGLVLENLAGSDYSIADMSKFIRNRYAPEKFSVSDEAVADAVLAFKQMVDDGVIAVPQAQLDTVDTTSADDVDESGENDAVEAHPWVGQYGYRPRNISHTNSVHIDRFTVTAVEGSLVKNDQMGPMPFNSEGEYWFLDKAAAMGAAIALHKSEIERLHALVEQRTGAIRQLQHDIEDVAQLVLA